ncbi:MAG: histidine kinase [Gemmatimonadota bacterium]
MNAATTETIARDGASPVVAPPGIGAILRSLTWREFGFFLLVALLISAINATTYFEFAAKDHASTKLLTGIVMPILVVPFCVCGWLLADRGSDALLSRTLRLVLCAAASALLAALLVPHVIELFGLAFNAEIRSDGKPMHVPDWLIQTSFGLDVAFFTGLSFAVLEMSRRRRRAEVAVAAEQREQAALTRQVLESRLAAMQAQVEPQFLFEALVDIERLYERDPAAAAANLDRLIQYLRVALPRLRDSGSSIQAEVELVESYLAVVQALHDGKPKLRIEADRDTACRTFYPMLLLPLIQRAVRRSVTMPASIDIDVGQSDHRVDIVVRIASAGMCADDDELERVRERLSGLYGGRAELACVEPGPGISQFTLRLPTAP